MKKKVIIFTLVVLFLIIINHFFLKSLDNDQLDNSNKNLELEIENEEIEKKTYSSNILENTTTFNFDEKNFISFRTRNNREIDLTEYYDLIYEYKNDCLVAGLKYNKTYYNDRDLDPTEDFMLSITLIPLTSIEQKVAN